MGREGSDGGGRLDGGEAEEDRIEEALRMKAR